MYRLGYLVQFQHSLRRIPSEILQLLYVFGCQLHGLCQLYCLRKLDIRLREEPLLDCVVIHSADNTLTQHVLQRVVKINRSSLTGIEAETRIYM